MTAAHPLPLPGDDLDVFPMDDAYLASLAPEIREAIAQAEEEGRAGHVVSHAEILRTLDEMRQRDG